VTVPSEKAALQGQTVTFVSTRYGSSVLGGAEQAVRSYATRLAADGWNVRVLASCASSYVTWANDFDPGTTIEEGVQVSRFPTVRTRASNFDALSGRLFATSPPSLDDAYAWIDAQGPDSPELLEAVAAVHEGVLYFIPYLYQSTVRGLQRAGVPAVLQGAFHHELPLTLPIFDPMVERADGLSFGTRAEQQLAHQRFASASGKPQVVLGLPIEQDGPSDPVLARHELGLGDEPFVLCLGRVDAGKGVHDLVDRFSRFRERYGIGRLVLAGPVVDAPAHHPYVTVLGPVPSEVKFGLLAAADLLINPSPNESFSMVVLEAFLVDTPVLVNGRCLPLREHCENSNGGFFYEGVADFDAALRRLLSDAELRQRMGQAGRRYAETVFSWPAVRTRFEALFSRLP